jgi:hypothetical protein
LFYLRLSAFISGFLLPVSRKSSPNLRSFPNSFMLMSANFIPGAVVHALEDRVKLAGDRRGFRRRRVIGRLLGRATS